MYELRLTDVPGEYMESATLVCWHVTVGSEIQVGQVIADVETAKATSQVESPVGGVVHDLLIEPGDEVDVGAILAYIQTGSEQSLETPDESGSAAATSDAAMESLHQPSVPDAREAHTPPPGPARSGRTPASPAARRRAREMGVSLDAVTGSGPGGRIVTEDVERAAAQSSQAFETASDAEGVPAPVTLSGYQRAAAEHLANATDVPQFSLTVQANLGPVDSLRKAEGVSYTVALIKMLADVLPRHPFANATWEGDYRIRCFDSAHIGVAVDTPYGLVVPVVHSPATLSLAEIQTRLNELASKGRERTLAPEDVRGGTFTLSNLGRWGIDSFTPVINPPQAAILGVGKIQSGPQPSGSWAWLTLSADHRILDGVAGARFLQDLKDTLEVTT